jgi:uncharacterized protein YfdQ (DUF2303 family)
MPEVSATLQQPAEPANLAETLAREMKKPEVFLTTATEVTDIALPPGWTIKRVDDEQLLEHPRRKRAAVTLTDTESFITYVNRHGDDATTTLWCTVDYRKQQITLRALLDDHGNSQAAANWRAHTATFQPAFSEEWIRWTTSSGKPMAQAVFAAWIEDNLRDITTAEGFPSGALMLEMALNMEAQQEARFRSKVRLQSGGVALEYVATDDDATVQKMAIFERFAIGVPVFWNGSAYGVEARLRYRIREGRVEFWYELIRPDKVFEQAAREIIARVDDEVVFPLFHGHHGGKEAAA